MSKTVKTTEPKESEVSKLTKLNPIFMYYERPELSQESFKLKRIV